MSTPSKTLLIGLGLGLGLLVLGPIPSATAASPSNATVTVVHGLPNFTADIYVNGKLLLDGFEPTNVAGPLQLKPGVYHVAIRDVGSSPTSKPALAGSVRLRPGGNYSVVAHLDEGGQPTLSVYRNPQKSIPPARAEVVVRPVATLPPVTLEANGRNLVSGVPSGREDSTVVPPGSYELEVFVHGTSKPVLPSQSITMREGLAYVLYVVGSRSDKSLGLMVQTVRGLATAPAGIESGTGGLVDHDGPPVWVLAAQVVAGLALVGSGLAIRRRASRDR